MNARGKIISYKWREYLLFLVNAAKEKLEMLLDTKWNIRTVSSQYLSEGGKRQKVSFRTPMAVHRNRKVLREDSTEKLNMILNSDIPRDLRLFILLDLKIEWEDGEAVSPLLQSQWTKKGEKTGILGEQWGQPFIAVRTPWYLGQNR